MKCKLRQRRVGVCVKAKLVGELSPVAIEMKAGGRKKLNLESFIDHVLRISIVIGNLYHVLSRTISALCQSSGLKGRNVPESKSGVRTTVIGPCGRGGPGVNFRLGQRTSRNFVPQGK